MAAFALLFALGAGPTAAQQVRGPGAASDSAARVLQEVLARRNYLRIVRDTVLPPSFHAPGDLLIVDADVRLEGRVEGAVAVLGGVLFLRPGASVGGPIAAVRGEVLASGKASHDAILETPLRYTVHLNGVAPDYEVEILSPQQPRRLQLEGIAGLGVPAYDRVDGLTLGASARLRLAEGHRVAVIRPKLSYHTARQAFDGGAALLVPLRQTGLATLGLERTTLSNDAWSSGDLYNSLAVALAGRDFRNYYAEDRATLRLERLALVPVIAGEFALAPRLELLAARDRSLEAHNVWSLAHGGGEWRPNPPIDEGTLLSATAGAALRWRGAASAVHTDLELEHGVGGVGDFAFTQVRGEASLHARAFGRQTMAIYARGVAPLDGGAPRQRWEILGGGAPSRPSPSVPDAATTLPSYARRTPSRCLSLHFRASARRRCSCCTSSGVPGQRARKHAPGHRTSAPASPYASFTRGSMSTRRKPRSGRCSCSDSCGAEPRPSALTNRPAATSLGGVIIACASPVPPPSRAGDAPSARGDPRPSRLQPTSPKTTAPARRPPLVEWVWRRARDTGLFDRLVVATDSAEVADAAAAFGALVEMTDTAHPSGTDRVAEVAAREPNQGFGVIVNVQGDEPFIGRAQIEPAVRAVRDEGWATATVAAQLRTIAEWRDPAVVKVVRDDAGGAMLFSRAAIPHPRDGTPSDEQIACGPYLRHVGLYVYQRDALFRWVALPEAELERIERLEQLRALAAGLPMAVRVVKPAPGGVDTPEDAERAEHLLRQQLTVHAPRAP